MTTMTTPMSVYARIAERYGVDSRDDEAVDEFFLRTAPTLPEAERERMLNELLESSSRPSELAVAAAKKKVKSKARVLSMHDAPPLPLPLNAFNPTKGAVETVRQVVTVSERPKPKQTYAHGEHVSVIDGPFTNFTGVVEEVNLGNHTLKVIVTIFGRSRTIDVDFIHVKPADPVEESHPTKGAGVT